MNKRIVTLVSLLSITACGGAAPEAQSPTPTTSTAPAPARDDEAALASADGNTTDTAEVNARSSDAPVASDAASSAPVASDAASPELSFEEQLDRDIVAVDDLHYTMRRDLLARLLADPTMIRGARLVPSVKSGKPNGLKVYAIRPSSLYARIGVTNGDTVHAINAIDVSHLGDALKALAPLAEAARVELTITRRGKPITLVIDLVD